MVRVSLVLVAGLLLASCQQDVVEPDPAASPGDSAAPDGSASAELPPASGARAVVEETDGFLFEYSYPTEAGDIPQLAALLGARLDEARNEIADMSAEGRELARDTGFPFNKYSSGTSWAVVTNTPRFLSLSAAISSYTGGAHGNYGFDTLVWDKQAEQALAPAEMFASIEALDAAIGPALCDLLNRERSVRRGETVEQGSDDPFSMCVPLRDTNVLLGSSTGRAFNRIGVQMAPYVAGPFAEGSFEFTIPVDDAVIATVKEEYRNGFATRN